MRKVVLILLVVATQILAVESKADSNINFGPRCKKFFSGNFQQAEVEAKIRCRIRIAAPAGAAIEFLHLQDSLTPGTSDRQASRIISGDESGGASTRITLRPGFLSTLQASSIADSCGNGICEEVVCLAIGCPESEDELSCPLDCGEVSILTNSR